jgi:hypothetical protein
LHLPAGSSVSTIATPMQRWANDAIILWRSDIDSSAWRRSFAPARRTCITTHRM